MMHWLLYSIALLVLVGCSGPLQTSGGIGAGGICVDGDGGYQMPRRDLIFVVTEETNTQFNFSYELGPAMGDDGDVYCLAYRGSGTASDQIALDIKEGLLQRVYSKTIDQTVGIAARVREGLAQAADREFSLNLEGVPSVLRLEVDPFDLEAMVITNAALRPYGYCVYLDASNDPYVPRWSQALCPQPGAAGQAMAGRFGAGADGKLGNTGLSDTDLGGATLPSLDNDPIDGVLYKPNVTHDLVVLRSQDPGGLGPWKLHTIAPVRLPNAAPTLIARIDRGAFVTRESELVFEDGVLVDAALEKTSEVNAVVDLTIEVFNTIFSIPVQILKLDANEAANRQRLIAANAQLLEETRNYREALESLDATKTEIAEEQAVEALEARLTKACEEGIRNEGDDEDYQSRVTSCLLEAKKCAPEDESCIAEAVREADSL